MSAPVINRQRGGLLSDVAAGRIYNSPGGCAMRIRRVGQNQRVDRGLRELTAAGWVALDADGRTYTLTPAGQEALRSALCTQCGRQTSAGRLVDAGAPYCGAVCHEARLKELAAQDGGTSRVAGAPGWNPDMLARWAQQNPAPTSTRT